MFNLLTNIHACNELAINISYLFLEVLFLGYIIIYIIIDCIGVLISSYKYSSTVFSISFTKRMVSVLEIVFLLVPTYLIGYLLIPSIGFLYSNEFSLDSLEYSFSVDITGHQWYWSYSYKYSVSDIWYDSPLITFDFDSIMIASKVNRLLAVDNQLCLPINTNILLNITSADVIHSWSLPELGIKVDAVPGRITSISFFTYRTGVFFGQCSELCGVNHAFMPISVSAVSEIEFFAWLSSFN